jgi:hypothetical protein
MALSGGLLRAGWTEDDTRHFVRVVAAAAGDEEARERADRSTAKRLDAERPATGWPSLAQIVGVEVVDKVTQWLGVTFSAAGDIPIVFGSQQAAESEWPADAAPEAFYGLAGGIVHTLAPHTEADPHALLISGLVAFGNAVGGSPHFQMAQLGTRCGSTR